jgi:hypothetical protein
VYLKIICKKKYVINFNELQSLNPHSIDAINAISGILMYQSEETQQQKKSAKEKKEKVLLLLKHVLHIMMSATAMLQYTYIYMPTMINCSNSH